MIKGYYQWKYKFCRLCVRNPVSGLLQIGCKLEKRNWSHFLHRQIFFFLSRLVTGPSFMLISSLVLELWQFPFIRDWPEKQKSEIPPSGFCPISGNWGNLGIPNLARISLIKCYWMLQNARGTTFTVSELLRKTQQEGGGITPSPTRLRVSNVPLINTSNVTLTKLYCLN